MSSKVDNPPLFPTHVEEGNDNLSSSSLEVHLPNNRSSSLGNDILLGTKPLVEEERFAESISRDFGLGDGVIISENRKSGLYIGNYVSPFFGEQLYGTTYSIQCMFYWIEKKSSE